MEAKKYRLDHPTPKRVSTQIELIAAFTKNAVKRLSTLTHSNSFSLSDNPSDLVSLLCALDKTPSERSEEEIEGIAKLLKQENLFAEIKNSMNTMRMLARQVTVQHLAPNQQMSFRVTKETPLYKLFKGEVTKRQASQSPTTIKAKGELLIKYEQCKQSTEIQVTSKEESTLLVFSQQEYEKALQIDRQNKSVMQLLVKTSIFSKFKRKELFSIVQHCTELTLSSKEVLFDQGDADSGFFYFLVDGELSVLKGNNQHKKQVVCYLTSGSLIGQQTLFEQSQPRTYAVAVQSSLAKILPISCVNFHQTIKHFDLNLSQILTPKYKEFLQLRKQHYSSQLGDNSEVKQTFQPSKYVNKMSQVKHQRMSNLLKDVENFTLQLNQKEKILERRYQMGKDYKDCKLISIERPLFGRQDYPGLKQLIKRYGINETKAKQNCRLPQL